MICWNLVYQLIFLFSTFCKANLLQLFLQIRGYILKLPVDYQKVVVFPLCVLFCSDLMHSGVPLVGLVKLTLFYRVTYFL